MKQILPVFVLALLAAAPAAAQPAGGMSAMGYYVGTWSCVGARAGEGPTNATVTYAMSGDVLTGNLTVPAQGKMQTPYYATFATSYDGKTRYIQTFLDGLGSWGISYAPTWTGNTEQWTDSSSSDGKLGHGNVVRTDNDHYTYTGYLDSPTPSFTTTCQRQH